MTPPVEPYRVLVVDDDEALVEACADCLVEAGFDVVTARDGRAALDRFREGTFDAVLSDIVMPDMDGLALLRTIRAHDLDVPFLVMTSAPDLRSAIDALNYGALRYLVRPVDGATLVATVSEAVRLSRLKRGALLNSGSAGSLPGEKSVSAGAEPGPRGTAAKPGPPAPEGGAAGPPAARAGKAALLREAAVGRCVTGVVHDAISPLATVGLRAEIMLGRLRRSDPEGGGRDAKSLQTILDEARRCAQQLAVLAEFAGGRPEGAGPLTLGRVLGDAAGLVAYAARRKGVRVRLHPGLAGLTLFADEGLVRQAALGLLAHAVAGAAPGSEVAIEGRSGEGEVILTCSWAGTGAAGGPNLDSAASAAAALGARLDAADGGAVASVTLAVPPSRGRTDA